MDREFRSLTPGELLEVLREFAAGRETRTGLDVDPAQCAAELVTLAESLAVLTSALAAAMVRYDGLDAGSPAALLVQEGHLTRSEAANLRALGRKLETELPATRERLAAGELSRTPVGQLGDAVSAYVPGEHETGGVPGPLLFGFRSPQHGLLISCRRRAPCAAHVRRRATRPRRSRVQ